METKLTKLENSIVMPLVSPEQAVAAFDAYQKLAAKIMTQEDVQKIGDKEFKKKSFWRKCQRFFNLSLELSKEWKEEKADKSYTYFVMYRAVAPNGAYMDGDGACTNNEKGRLRTEHDTRSTAHTRAKNRAISDLVAFGEVSAEEVDGHEENNNQPSSTPSVPMMTEFQAKRIYTLREKSGLKPQDFDETVKKICSYWPDTTKITLAEANKIADSLEKMLDDIEDRGDHGEVINPDDVDL